MSSFTGGLRKSLGFLVGTGQTWSWVPEALLCKIAMYEARCINGSGTHALSTWDTSPYASRSAMRLFSHAEMCTLQVSYGLEEPQPVADQFTQPYADAPVG